MRVCCRHTSVCSRQVTASIVCPASSRLTVHAGTSPHKSTRSLSCTAASSRVCCTGSSLVKAVSCSLSGGWQQSCTRSVPCICSCPAPATALPETNVPSTSSTVSLPCRDTPVCAVKVFSSAAMRCSPCKTAVRCSMPQSAKAVSTSPVWKVGSDTVTMYAPRRSMRCSLTARQLQYSISPSTAAAPSAQVPAGSSADFSKGSFCSIRHSRLPGSSL